MAYFYLLMGCERHSMYDFYVNSHINHSFYYRIFEHTKSCQLQAQISVILLLNGATSFICSWKCISSARRPPIHNRVHSRELWFSLMSSANYVDCPDTRTYRFCLKKAAAYKVQSCGYIIWVISIDKYFKYICNYV